MERINAVSIPSIVSSYDDSAIRKFGNKCISNPLEEHNKELNIKWTAEEKAIFTKSYLQHPKMFGTIAETLPNKSLGQCVQYYYISKQNTDYKRMFKTLKRQNCHFPCKMVPKRPFSSKINLESVTTVAQIESLKNIRTRND